MATLIAYASKYGSTEKCAQKLRERLGDGVTLVNLSSAGPRVLDEFESVIIGGSIYVGKIQPEVTKFCQENLDALLQKKVALFVCCADLERAEEQMRAAFDNGLLEHAVAWECLGYELNLGKMDFFSRMILRVVKKVKKSQSFIDEKKIEQLAVAIG